MAGYKLTEGMRKYIQIAAHGHKQGELPRRFLDHEDEGKRLRIVGAAAIIGVDNATFHRYRKDRRLADLIDRARRGELANKYTPRVDQKVIDTALAPDSTAKDRAQYYEMIGGHVPSSKVIVEHDDLTAIPDEKADNWVKDFKGRHSDSVSESNRGAGESSETEERVIH